MWTPSRIEDWATKILEKSSRKTSGIFRHEGISDFAGSPLRKMVSELGAGLLTD